MRSNETKVGAAALLAGLAMSSPALGESQVSWRGLQIENEAETATLEIGGRLHLDTAAFDEELTVFEDKSDVRRARLDATLTLNDDWRIKIDGDVGGLSPGMKNAWIAYRGFDHTLIKVGNFIAPFSMEDMGSSNNLPLMERSLAQALAPGFQVGGGVSRWGERWSASVGYSTDPIDDDPFVNNDEGQSVTARFVFNPVRERHHVVHLGAAVEVRDLDDGVASRVSTRPEAGVATARLIDTGMLSGVDGFTNIGIEGGVINGPFMIHAQAIRRTNDAPTLGDPTFTGGFVQAAWALTGETRRYSRSSGVIGGLRPRKRDRFGAWELAGRVSMLDLEEAGVTGGEEVNYTAGVNWYVNRNVRFMANYVRAEANPNSSNLDESLNVVEGRIQIAF